MILGGDVLEMSSLGEEQEHNYWNIMNSSILNSIWVEKKKELAQI